MTARDLLSSSALRLNAGSFGLGTLSFWGRGAYSRFDGSDDDLMMQGEVVSATVGVDYGCGRCLYGVALSHSSADGNFGFSGSDLASVTSELTGLYPYYGYRVTKRLWVWGLAGYGVGEMTSEPASGRTAGDRRSHLASGWRSGRAANCFQGPEDSRWR